MKARDLVAAGSGFVFAVGLAIAGMTEPAKVAGFLDVTGHWDPSLALVMVGAIGVHLLALRLLRGKRERPRFAETFHVPSATQVDARLLGGAAIFGVGWGIAGFCPGPAVVSIVTGAPDVLAFVAAMLGGMFVYSVLFERREARDDGASSSSTLTV